MYYSFVVMLFTTIPISIFYDKEIEPQNILSRSRPIFVISEKYNQDTD